MGLLGRRLRYAGLLGHGHGIAWAWGNVGLWALSGAWQGIKNPPYSVTYTGDAMRMESEPHGSIP